MIKTSIGELKLSPIKEEGKFLFFNDFISINGKISKGDKINIYVGGYDIVNGTYIIKQPAIAHAVITVRGKVYELPLKDDHKTVDDFYKQVSELYKSHFYFGDKA